MKMFNLVTNLGAVTSKRKALSENTQVAILTLGTVGLLVTIGALNGGQPLTSSAWDAFKLWLTTLLSSTWVIMLALVALVAAVWQLAHGKGYAGLGLVLGIVALAELGPGAIETLATATREPVAFNSPSTAPTVAPTALKLTMAAPGTAARV